MNITGFIQTLFFRDLVTYLIPGICLLTGIFYIFHQDSDQVVQDYLSRSIFIFLLFLAAYVAGFVVYLTSDLLRRKLMPQSILEFKKPSQEIKDRIQEILENDSISQLQDDFKLRDDYYMTFCECLIQDRFPTIHYTKIERLSAMRNFRVGLAGVCFVLFVIVIINYFYVYYQYDNIFHAAELIVFAVAMLGLSRFLFLSSYKKDRELYKKIFEVFWTVSVLNELSTNSTLISKDTNK